MTIEIGLLITVISCFLGILGYLTNRDKKIMNDSEWKGTVNAKLDIIIGVKEDIKEVKEKLEDHTKHAEQKIQDHETRISLLENKKE